MLSVIQINCYLNYLDIYGTDVWLWLEICQRFEKVEFLTFQ